MCYTCKSPPQPVSFCMIARKRHNVKMEFYTCIAKYAFFGIRDEKLLATARKSWYHTMVCSGIEAVITGLTRNQFVGNHTRVRIPPAAPYKQRSKFGSQKRGRQMPASFLCHKHSTKASFHGLSSFTKRVAQKEKTGKSFCQNSCKAFFEPGGLIFNRYLFCSVYPEKDKP